MQDQQPNHASTPGEIIDYYDTHPDLTLRELATMTGRTVAYLKGLLNHPEKVKA
jgi:plasmid maintenance system antidote protein VapI